MEPNPLITTKLYQSERPINISAQIISFRSFSKMIDESLTASKCIEPLLNRIRRPSSPHSTSSRATVSQTRQTEQRYSFEWHLPQQLHPHQMKVLQNSRDPSNDCTTPRRWHFDRNHTTVCPHCSLYQTYNL